MWMAYDSTLIGVLQMARLTAREMIQAARPGVEVKPNRYGSEQPEFPFELCYKGQQVAVGRHEDTLWRDAVSGGVLGTESVPPMRIDSKPVVTRRSGNRGWGNLAS
jgi:hypothetical protein